MRKIEVIVSPHELEKIRAAFLEAGISNMSVSEVREYGADTRHTELYRSEEYVVDSKSKCKIETIIPQNLVARAVAVLSRSRQREKGENGTIIISTVNDVNR